MSVGGITDFLSELGEVESLSVLREAYSRQSVFIFKIENVEQAIKVKIGAFIDKRVVIIPEQKNISLPTDILVSIKFNIGTEVYFVKPILKAMQNRYYFDMSTKVIQLKRRKEPRFVVPKNWNQNGCIVVSRNSNEQIKCHVYDISNSGIRFEVLDQFPIKYNRDDIIHVRFQIHKRAEVSSMAIIRFALVRPGFNALLGMEFANISDVQAQRVTSIVGDIEMHVKSLKI